MRKCSLAHCSIVASVHRFLSQSLSASSEAILAKYSQRILFNSNNWLSGRLYLNICSNSTCRFENVVFSIITKLKQIYSTRYKVATKVKVKVKVEGEVEGEGEGEVKVKVKVEVEVEVEG